MVYQVVLRLFLLTNLVLKDTFMLCVCVYVFVCVFVCVCVCVENKHKYVNIWNPLELKFPGGLRVNIDKGGVTALVFYQTDIQACTHKHTHTHTLFAGYYISD